MSGGVLKWAGIVTLGTLLGRILGFGRETVLAARFGAGATVDAFQNAILIPVTLFMPLAATLSTALIPVYARRTAESGREGALRTVNSLVNASLLVSLMLAALAFLSAPALSALVAPGFDARGRALVAEMVRLAAPAMVFITLAAVVTGFLQARNSFLLPAMAGIPMNGLTIAAILALAPTAGIAAAAIGTMVGAAAYLAIQLPGLRAAGYRYMPVLDLRDPGLRMCGRMLGPLMLGTLASQLVLYVNRVIASGLPAGSISYLNYATRVAEVPLSIFGAAIGTVIYPALSRHVLDSTALFRRALVEGVRAMLFVVAPMAVGLALLREPVIRVLFERGAFGAPDTAATSAAVLGLSVGLVPAGVAVVWAKGLYALGDTRSPLLVSLATIVVVVVFSFALIGPLSHAGLALASSLGQVFYALGIAHLMRRRVGAIGGSQLLTYTARVTAACAAMAAAVLAVQAALAGSGILAGAGLLSQAMELALLIAVGAAVYVAGAALLGLPETALLGRLASWPVRLLSRRAPAARLPGEGGR